MTPSAPRTPLTEFRALMAALAVAAACAGPPAIAQSAGPLPATAPGGRAALRVTFDSILAKREFAPAIIGILVIDAETLDTLYARNAHTAMMPASNMKIVTGAMGLAQLGAGYRYRTTFELRGGVRDSVLTGDLFVFGGGDPTISQRMRGNPLAALSAIADSLRARGVKRIDGRLVHAGNSFPGNPRGWGWSHDYLDEDYAAGVDELMYNEGLDFVPGHPTGGDTLWTNAAPDPATAYMHALRAALAMRNVEVRGAIARDSLATPNSAATRFEISSPPLSEILGAMEKPSQNQIAEVVFRTLALERHGAGRSDSARAIVTRELRRWGADSLEFLIADGSGLSRYNLLSPATVTRVLLTMRSRPDFATFLAALPGVGSEGTVRSWLRDTRASQVVRGKTGTLFAVRSFSGYATSADGRPIVFSFLSNHFLIPTARITEAYQQMLRALTELPLSP